jgi:hypothetical protein
MRAAVIAPHEMNNRAFGPRELLGREIDGVEDERSVRAPPESCAGCESMPVGGHSHEHLMRINS